MERDPLAKSDQYETDEEIREQPAWSEPNISPDIEQRSEDWAVTRPHDAHVHGDVDESQTHDEEHPSSQG